MPIVGKQCPICEKVHIVKPMNVLENLTPKQRTQTFKAEAEHRLFIDGYYCSLDMDSEVWEFYEPLTFFRMSIKEEKGKEEKAYCRLCNKEISKEESEQNLGYCQECFYVEEVQDVDDL